MIRVVPRLAVAALALVWLATSIDLPTVGHALAATSRRAVLLATVASFVGNVVVAFRLRVLLGGQGVAGRASQMLAINLAAFFYNLFLPAGGVGVAALRLQRLSARTRGGFTAALTAMVCDRLAALAGLGVIGLAGWVADPQPKPPGGLLVLLAGTSAIGVLAAPRAVPTAWRAFLRELQAGGGGTWWSAALARLRRSLGSVARLSSGTLARILGLAIVAQIPGVFGYVALGRGLGIDVTFAAMAWVRSVVVLFTVLPISIGGLGVREGVLVLTLAAYGVPAADALALSILVFATTILAPGLVGGVLEGWHWRRGDAPA
ncbi:MAG: flippase-like domain-containing protein [Deltaproteobacteria bacterium]|nr:flippase-like domain-containing protein [Deltaproteobacteria bacterium]